MSVRNFFFAFVDPDTAFDPTIHNVDDLDVFSFSMSQAEGDFAQLSVTIKNPKIGLLAPGRKQWLWFSWFNGTAIVPRLLGRLVALPDNLFDTTITLVFTAKPSDFLARKAALAATMRNLPFWDPIFITPNSWSDDDTVLEARSELWHIDPVTHEVTSSDIIVGDSVVEFQQSDIFYDGVQVNLQASPVSTVTMQATIPWQQSATGSVDLGRDVLGFFGNFESQKFQQISSFTFTGLASSWPKPGASIGDGWVVTVGELLDQSFLSVPAAPLIFPGIFDTSDITPVATGSIVFPIGFTGTTYSGVDGASIQGTDTIVVVPIGWGVPELVLQYTRGVQYAQVVTFTLSADMQELMTDDDADETIALTLSANPVSDITFDDSIPLGALTGRDYVHSARGRQSVEYLIMVARANLLAKARAITITYQTTFDLGLPCSLRMNALIHDPRLPGGQAIGKITSYSHDLDGSDGTPLTSLTIACAVGFGGSFTSSPGTGAWVDDAYVDPAYQEHNNQISLTPTSDVQFQLDPSVVFDDGLNFAGGLSNNQAVLDITVKNDANVQKAAILAISGVYGDQAAISTLLGTIPTTVSLLMAPMSGGPFKQEVAIGLSDLIVPQQINLEAPSD